MTQATLNFDALARRTDPPTSRLAASELAPKLNALQRQMLAVLTASGRGWEPERAISTPTISYTEKCAAMNQKRRERKLATTHRTGGANG